MTRDGPGKVPSKVGSTLDTVLSSLSALESCTNKTLELVRDVLNVNAASELPARRQRHGKADAKTIKVSKLDTPIDQCRVSMSIIKTCLKTLMECNRSPSSSDPSSEHDRIAPITSKSLKTSKTSKTSLIAQICTIALDTWASGTGTKAVDVAMARSNFISRLVDHGMVRYIANKVLTAGCILASTIANTA